MKQQTFALENFEGPLTFLLHLIQKNEINISDIPIKQIIEQYPIQTTPDVDEGAEFIATTAFLLWLKSKLLLPSQDLDSTEIEELDPQFTIIHQLIDYYRFKHISTELSQIEDKQSTRYNRGLHPLDLKSL